MFESVFFSETPFISIHYFNISTVLRKCHIFLSFFFFVRLVLRLSLQAVQALSVLDKYF